ncbi:MAG: TPM domain-containing protein, partial [Deltaproteobacteria bacterium]|nr:TPM domain-containing protein [Deltaproteobacteria bacterium]
MSVRIARLETGNTGLRPHRLVPAVLCALSLLASTLTWAQVPVPPLQSLVTDLAAVLTEAQRSRLEALLRDLERRKGSQVAVLLVPTTEPEAIEQFGIRVAEAWKLGRKGVDDGAILLVALRDRTLRIEVGYGLEGALTDALAKRIISEVILPRFKNGDLAGGLQAG